MAADRYSIYSSSPPPDPRSTLKVRSALAPAARFDRVQRLEAKRPVGVHGPSVRPHELRGQVLANTHPPAPPLAPGPFDLPNQGLLASKQPLPNATMIRTGTCAGFIVVK